MAAISWRSLMEATFPSEKEMGCCTAVHDQRSIFAGFPHKTPITKGAITLSSSPSVPSNATDKGEFGRILGLQPQLDVRTPPEFSGQSASSETKFAENFVDFQTTPGPFPQVSLP